MLRKVLAPFVVCALSVIIVLKVSGQETRAIASDLMYPRGLAYDSDGNLFIAEAGIGGEIELTDESLLGLTGRISMVAPDGTRTTAVSNLPSVLYSGVTSWGVYRVLPTTDAIWLGISELGAEIPYSNAVVRLDRGTLRLTHYLDLYSHETANNPDGAHIESNVADIAFGPDDTLYIVDAGANAVLTWTENTGLQTLLVWRDNPVPAAIDFDPDGDIYIGFLGAAIAVNAGHIEHWSSDGSELIETFGNLTALTDILIDPSGIIYGVQMSETSPGLDNDTGSVVRISANSVIPILENLRNPISLAMNPEGNLVVGLDGAFAAPGTGSVIELLRDR